MTEEQFYSKVDELIDNSITAMKKIARKLVLSRAINLKDAEDNFRLPKQVVYAIFNEMKFQHKPLEKSDIKQAENICLFT